ncbi:MAG: hypothetical protein Q9163_005696 [Psora crenata]
MSRVFYRLASSAISASTKRVANELAERSGNVAPPLVRRQLLDSNQLQRLSVTLDRPRLYSDVLVDSDEERGPGGPLAAGTPLPPGYHLAYFTPAVCTGELGLDGIDVSYSPSPPFTRRMWAGGRLRWEKDNPLRVGDEATEATRLVSAEAKVTRNGEEMIVVGIEKTFANARGRALVDRRDWVFRTQLSGGPVAAAAGQINPAAGAYDDVIPPLPAPSGPSVRSRDFLQTPVSLFRFSALTFNGHKIHYSRPWCREVEGHRDIVVHGPLNLINMLDFWRDEKGGAGYMIPQSIRYRATAPFYAGEKYRALLEEDDGGRTTVKMWGSDGQGNLRVGMIGDLVD